MALLPTPRRRSLATLGLLSLVSPYSFAFGEQISDLGPDMLEILSLVIGGLLVVLIVLQLISARRVKRLERQTNEHQQNLETTQTLMEGFSTGMLHLDADGQILFANKVAAYYFAKRADELMGQPFLQLFASEQQAPIQAGLAQRVFNQCQVYVAARERHLSFGFDPKSNRDDEVAYIIAINDVTAYQQDHDHQVAEIAHRETILDTVGLGQIVIDLEEEQFSINPLLAQLVSLPQDKTTGPLAQINDLVDTADVHTWTHAIAELKSGQSVDVQCRFSTPEGRLLCRVVGVVAAQDEENKPTKLHLSVAGQQELYDALNKQQVCQQRVNGLLSANSNAAYLLDENGQVLECNQAFEVLFRTRKSQVLEKSFADLSVVPQELKDLHSSGSSGRAKELTLSLVPDEVLHVKIKTQGFVDKEGKRAGLVGIVEDITDQREAELALKQERERFTAILDKAPVAIAMLDADDQITQVNGTMTQRLGLTQEEFKKDSFYELFNDPYNSGKAAKQLHKTGSVSGFHALLKGKDGTLHPSELHIDLFDPEKQQYLCWIFDVSDEQFEADRFENLLEHSSMPMAVLGDKGFTKLNPAACEFFRLQDESELFGFYPHSEGLNADADAISELEGKLNQLKLDGKAQSLLWQHKVGDELLPCQATYVPMFKGEQLDSILCIWMDMRAIRRADEERLQAINLHQAAEREVAEKQELLRSSQDMLAAKVKTLADTETRLQEAKEDLSETQSEFSSLQQAHEDITQHMQSLQQDYNTSRNKLAEAQRSNEEMESQLEHYTAKVGGLEKQRNDIANALQNSERQYQRAQRQLEESEVNSQRLKQEQKEQEQKMAGFEQQIGSLQASIEQKDQQINDVNGQISSLQSQLTSSGQTSEKLRQALINQRKASEEAEVQRRDLEQTYLRAQAELSTKARHVEHLQHEMQKFEEMSSQEKGDMAQQQKLLEQELAAKQQQLQDTQEALDETKRQTEQEKAEKVAQQQRLEQLQQEMTDVEQRAAEQQAKMDEAERQKEAQQQAFQEELKAKQQQLQQTQEILNEAKQQTEAEKAEKARQQQIFEQLQSELSEMEQRSSEQQQEMASADEQWLEKQRAMQAELEAKQQQLQQTQQKLDENQRQADAERLQRMEQQQKLDQLKVELHDVENRASKQREMMEGSDEQWRQHHAEIEAQKKQLQQALEAAQQQNSEMQHKLQSSLQELQQAESQVSETQSGEQKLQQELEQARQQAEQLNQKLAQQEAQEEKLQAQLTQQQQALQDSQQNVNHLQDAQEALTEELRNVQQEYSETQKNLSTQDDNQSELNEQLKALESQLQQSKAQLDDKEHALQDAQQQLQSKEAKLAEQEEALLAASKEELKQAQQEDAQDTSKPLPEFAKLDMPANPEIWFDLLPYLQENPHTGSLAEALNKVIDEMSQSIDAMDKATADFDEQQTMVHTRKLVFLIRKINTEPLKDLANRLDADFQNGLVDNISIFWPNAKKSLMTTLRVIWAQLNA